jgi:hypothetical protein
MKRQKQKTLGDQWNIILPDSATADELRACVYYEYARESDYLVQQAELHRRLVAGIDHKKHSSVGSNRLSNIETVSVPLAGMVRAMASKASLAKPWSKLSADLKAKMVASCAISVRLATHEELQQSYSWSAFQDEPEADTIFHIDKNSMGAKGEDSRRLACFVLDACATAAQVRQGIMRVFEESIAPLLGGRAGRGASGKEALRKALSDLAALRLLSTRETSTAETVADKAGMSALLPDKKSAVVQQSADTYRYERMRSAIRTFRQLFPRLFLEVETTDLAPMLSVRAYFLSHPRGRPRGRRQRKILS